VETVVGEECGFANHESQWRVFLYNPHSRKQFESEFGAYAIDVKTPLSSGDSRRQGFLFFQTPDKRPVRSGQQLTLSIERLPQPVSLTIH
jgi:hypothetical protein